VGAGAVAEEKFEARNADKVHGKHGHLRLDRRLRDRARY
jgi:hypothetical protein